MQLRHSEKSKEIRHLIYRISGQQDIINPFSLDGFELLSPSFLSFMDLMCPTGADHAPIILEITGAELDEKQRKTIDDAIWLHYRLHMTRIARSLRACTIKILWFFLCTLLSSICLYLVTKRTTEVATQFFYLPIWFFGYRLLTYPLQEYLPLYRELRRYRRLAALKLVFSESPLPSISEQLAASVRKENALFYDKAMDGIRSADLIRNFTLEDGTVRLGCYAESAEALLHPCSVPGNQLLSEELAAFLCQAEPFVNPDKPVEFQICGLKLTDEEKHTVSAAAVNYFRLHCRQAESDLRSERRHIACYSLGLAVSCLVLFLCGKSVGLGMHEFMLIALWFFGDYLFEFLLLGLSDSKYTVRQRRRLADLNILFEK